MENSNGRYIIPKEKKADIEQQLSNILISYGMKDRSKGMVRLLGIKVNQIAKDIENNLKQEKETIGDAIAEFPIIRSFILNLMFEGFAIPWLKAKEHRAKFKAYKKSKFNS